MTTEYANFTDAHIPTPTRHAPRLHAYQAAGGPRGTRFVLSEHADRDRAQATQAFLTADPEAVVEVRP